MPNRLRLALDSSPVRGRGAVKDTFNLLSDAIVAIVRAVARSRQQRSEEVAHEAGLARHIESPSIKGSELVDWGDSGAVSAFLGGLIEDGGRAVALADQAGCATEEVALLRKVIAQDVEPDPQGGVRIREGVTPDRTVSVHDPEIRHGHKSNGKVYSGHKASLAIKLTSGVITSVDVTAPADPDGAQVRSLLERTEALTGCPVDYALGDTAYSTRTALAQAKEARVRLLTKMPAPPKGRYGPSAFRVSRGGKRAVCPAGHRSLNFVRRAEGYLHRWAAPTCTGCPLKSACTRAAARTLLVPPDFHDRRQRERYANSERGRRRLRQRVVAEHGIGRLKKRGAGAARYCGRAKTRAQLFWTAAVANLSLAWAEDADLAA